jgi:hypothetical protein
MVKKVTRRALEIRVIESKGKDIFLIKNTQHMEQLTLTYLQMIDLQKLIIKMITV